MIEHFQRLNSCFPQACYVLLDDVPRMGSGLTADLIHIQGYFSLSDQQESWNHCLPKLLDGQPVMTSLGQEHLAMSRSERKLVSLETLHKQNLYALTEKEWLCFRHLISGGELTHLAQTLRLRERSAKNLKYRVMKKLNAQQFVDLLRMAQEWGFLDRP
jgi:DNA-binding NarL/FixJ family response regulator